MNAKHSSFGWRFVGYSVFVLLIMLILMYRDTVLYLIGLWNDLENGEYGHGYLILSISVYLIVRNRRTLSALTPCPSYLGLVAVLVASLLWSSVVLVDVLKLQPVGLLLLILAIVWAMLGNKVTRTLLFPMLFIGFAIPIWFPLNPVLQELSADVVFWFIRVLGIPAFRQDNEIVLPAGSLSVTEACSGLRYLLPGLALGALYGYLNYATLMARFIVLLIAASASILVNIVRVVIIVYLGYATDMQHPFIEDHLVLGWYLFGGMVVVLLVADILLSRYCRPSETGNAERKCNALTVSCDKGMLQQMSIFVAIAVLLSTGPVVVYWVNHHQSSENTLAELVLPSGSGDWKGPIESNSDWMPDYRGAIARKQSYHKGDKRLDLYIGYYQAQKQSKELIYYANRIGNPEFWHSRNPKGTLIQINDHKVLEQLLEKEDGEKILVWYWYRVAGQYITNSYQAKVFQVLGLITGNPQAYVMAVAVNGGEIPEARKILGDFVSAMETPLMKFMEESHSLEVDS